MTSHAALAKKPADKSRTDQDPWRGFNPGDWRTGIDVRNFIVRNVTPYTGDESFLASSTPRTKAVWAKLQSYFKDEQK
jgi:formate C-acetyltransferase